MKSYITKAVVSSLVVLSGFAANSAQAGDFWTDFYGSNNALAQRGRRIVNDSNQRAQQARQRQYEQQQRFHQAEVQRMQRQAMVLRNQHMQNQMINQQMQHYMNMGRPVQRYGNPGYQQNNGYIRYHR